VLVVSLIGLAIVGAVLQLTVLSSGSGRVVSAGNEQYNLLQTAVERGRTALKRAMYTSYCPPRYYAPGGIISEIDDLLINYYGDYGENDRWCGKGMPFESERLEGRDLGRLGIAGTWADLTVKIYDLQYPTDDAVFRIPYENPDQVPLIPPSMMLFDQQFEEAEAQDIIYSGVGGDPEIQAGVYLIRASLVIDGRGDRPVKLDAAVIQANRPDPTEPTDPPE
jgi:hypothetical protein